MLAAALAGGAFVAGVAGAWSPCGFSAVETIGAAETRSSLVASCLSFASGALAGAAATFLALSAVGSLVPRGPAVGVAVAVALAAAVAEACGVRIVPQVRRQVPETWRRVLPLPLASLGYGVLLGLGFVTFVFTLAFWALAAIALLLGKLSLGLVLAAGFGAGRALPIVALAPLSSRRLGRDLVDAMAMRPIILRTTRIAAALALVTCAAALLAGRASAAVVARGVTDPSVDAGVVAWEGTTRSTLEYSLGALGGASDAHHTGPLRAPLPGRNAAVGGGLVAWRAGDVVHVVRRSDFGAVADVTIPGANALAVSARWLVARVSTSQQDRLVAHSLLTGDSRSVASAPRGTLGRPSLAGDSLVYHVDSAHLSRIVLVDLVRGARRVVRRSRLAQLSNPSLSGGWLLYVRSSSIGQRLVRGPLGDPVRDRTLLTRGPTAARDNGYEPGYGHETRTPRTHRTDSLLWTTALASRSAYLTVYSLRRGRAGSRIVRIGLGKAQPPTTPSSPTTLFPASAPPELVYTASSPSGDSLVGVTLDGSEELLATASRLEDPAWSPDGSRVAYAGNAGIFVTPLGGSPVQLTRGKTDADPAWSPDGARLVFVRNGALYTVDAGGSGVRRVTRSSVRSQEPAWSPDGARLAFASRRGGNWDIYTTDLAGHERRLTHTAAAEGYPAWSPDGREIAFDRRGASGLRVFVVAAGGGKPSRVTSGPGDDFHASWSPDGTQLAFVSDRDGRPRVWVAPAAGGQASPLGSAGGIEDAPAWRSLPPSA